MTTYAAFNRYTTYTSESTKNVHIAYTYGMPDFVPLDAEKTATFSGPKANYAITGQGEFVAVNFLQPDGPFRSWTIFAPPTGKESLFTSCQMK